MTYKIAIIGSGQLGSRHLQSLLKLNIPVEIEVFDPNEESLIIAQKRAEEVPFNQNIKSVNYFKYLSNLSKEIDLCIIATNSNVRLKVVNELIEISKVKNLILEKVLFQNISEYYLADKIFKNHKINVWVNCPRRMYSIYNEIKKKITSGDLITFSLIGGNWGLACNSIHFIDLFVYFTGNTELDFDSMGLVKCHESKRSGFIEFSGTLKASQKNGNQLFLHSNNSNKLESKIIITSNNYFWEIDELNETILTKSLTDNHLPVLTKISIPYQSQLTSIAVEDILLKKQIQLTNYEDSKKIHIQMIQSFIKQLDYLNISRINDCPIT